MANGNVAVQEPRSEAFDPILSQVIHHYELTVNREMGRAVVNLSGSPLFVGASDFACACLDAEGNNLTNIAWSLQMGYAVSNTVQESLRRFGDNLYPGDMIFCNDPYAGGGLHSSDVIIVTPVFLDDELAMWVGVSAHVTDVGGAVPGGFSVEPMECYGENVRFTPVKFYEKGVYKPEIVDAFLTNVRLPERTGIDLKAMMGANWIGRERMEAMLRHYGRKRIDAIHADQLAQSEAEMRRRLEMLPDGVFEGAAHMEHDGAEDRIYTIRARIIKEGDNVTFDFSDTDKQAIGILNSAYVGSMGNVVAALETVVAPDVPFNEGVMVPVQVVSPPGTLVNAIKPAPISGATIFGAWFGTDAILEAINYALAGNPETANRRTGPWGSWTFAWLHCTNQYGEPWFFNIFTGGCGGAGALPFRDGEPAMMGIQTIDSFTANIEDYEIQSPVLMLYRGFADNTGGAGMHRGGLALDSLAIPWDTDRWDVTVFHNRLTAPAPGVSGGFPGSTSSIAVTDGAGDDARARWDKGEALPLEEYISSSRQFPTRAKGLKVMASDVYYIRATGGPGYGDPIEREPSRVAEDIGRRYVSDGAGREAYGVVLSDGAVDQEATERARAEVREARKARPPTKDVLADAYEVRPGSGGAAVSSDGPLILGEYLLVSPEGAYRCRRCDHQFGSNRENWKWYAGFDESPTTPESIKTFVKPRPQDDLVFRQYYCPGCGVQVDTEIALRGEPPRWNYRPLEVWRALQSEAGR